MIFFQQTWSLTWAQMKVRYRRTWAGFLWTIMNPLVIFSIQAFIFQKILRLDMSNYSIYLMSGLLPWLFISQSIESSTALFSQKSQTLKTMQINPLVLMTSAVSDHFINLLAVLVLLALPYAIFNPQYILAFVVLPLALGSLLVFVLSVCWILSLLNVFFRDVKFMATFFLSVCYFATPIFYPPEMLPADWAWIAQVNPLYHAIHPFQLLAQNTIELSTFGALGISLGFSSLFVWLGFSLWKKLKNQFYFQL